MKKVKLTYYLVMLLSLISLVSVGFASWTVTDDFSVSTSGMIVVDDVMKVNDYIICDKNSVTKFGYVKSGFVSKNEQGKTVISNSSTISATITINIANCKKKFNDCNSLEIDIFLESKNLAIFNNKIQSNISVVVTDALNPSNEIDAKTDGVNVLWTIINLTDYKSLSNEIKLNVIYTFSVSDNTYFRDEIYDILRDNKFNFVLSAKLTGKVDSNEN